jgi:hypothetical protein
MAGGLLACVGIGTLPVLVAGGATWVIYSCFRQDSIKGDYQRFVNHWHAQGYIGP